MDFYNLIISKDSQKQASLSSKAQSTLKRDHSSSSVHNHNSHRSEKINTNKGK
jgi:hypothetical protein